MSAAKYRAELADGSRLERDYKLDGERAVGYGSWYWRVYDPDRRPKRKRVNLRTKDKSAAMRKAMELAGARSLGTYDPWADAAPVGASMDDAAKAYLASQRQAGRAEKTVEAARRLLAAFGRSLPPGAQVAHVERGHVERFVAAPKPGKDGQPGPPKSAATRRRYLAVLGHFFRFSVRSGFTRRDPTADLSAPTVRANRRDHVTEAEAGAMLRALDAAEVLDGPSVGWVRDWFVFGLGTGLRPGEQAALDWRDVRLAEGAVRVRGTKTAQSDRVVPVAGDALTVLRRRHAARTGEGGGLVFTAARGGPVEMRSLSRRLQALAAGANVGKNVTAYSLRHSYGTRMSAAGVPLLDLARIMGTSAVMIEKHYGHYDPARGASHVARVFGVDDDQAKEAVAREEA
ncbi:tyrosine-type recombinase/integrase [Rubrivirga sp. IMCC43871]|uniref:tyrosine-type recombinase/integrase n=1 Tax=Rubrivirga sp. IMCC43871 TaxID=3391575 RepID=UPI0039903A22